jgi:hypothetical protein
MAAEFEEAGLYGVQHQSELRETLREVGPEPPGFGLALKVRVLGLPAAAPVRHPPRGSHGISRFSRKVVSVHARGLSTTPVRHPSPLRVVLPSASYTAWAPRTSDLSRLNTPPARTAINASGMPSRTCPHDSGPPWVATPFSVWLFHPLHLAKRCTLPSVAPCRSYPGAS